MTYNTKPRRRFTSKQRATFLIEHDCRCYWCGEKIHPGQPWDIEHMLARELMAPDDDADADENLRPIHAHPAKCHKEKTANDRKLIAKSNRIRRRNGPPEERRKPRVKIKGRGFQQGHRPIPNRPFPKRGE